MPVLRDGKQLGRVTQFLLDDHLTEMQGVWLDCGIRGIRFLRSNEIDLLGEIAVLAHREGKRARCDEKPFLRRALSGDGSRAGAITDALIDERTRHICALELSRGYIDDLLDGRRRVWHYQALLSGDVVVEAAGESEGGMDG